MNSSFSIRDKSILIGLYLSKYDDEALATLGFESVKAAFNTLGYAIGAKPASIKNYRDEFDPYFPNLRKGWHKRQLRNYCEKFLEEFENTNFLAFTELVKGFLIKDYAIEQFIDKIEKKDFGETIAKRLVTGIAAEEYFKSSYYAIPDFANYNLHDTTKLACGFDFHLTFDVNYYCVEVKGLNANFGSIAMTEKEFLVAQNLRDNYCLFIVSNFIDTPVHQYFFDPLNSRLSFKKVERPIIQTTYSTQI